MPAAKVTLTGTGSYVSIYSIVAMSGLNLKVGDTLALQHASSTEHVAVNFDYIAYTLSNSDNIPVVTLH